MGALMIEHWLEMILVPLENDVVVGGLILGLIGSMTAMAWAGLGGLAQWLRQRLTVEIAIESRDRELFQNLLVWLDQHPGLKNCRRLTLSQDNDSYLRQTPAQGLHFFFDQKWPILLDRDKSDRTDGASKAQQRSMAPEVIRLTSLSWSREKFFRRIHKAVTQSAAAKEEVKTIRLYCGGPYHWNLVEKVVPRPLSTLILAEPEPQHIVDDIAQFLADAEWYRTRGVPWRRGYLLEGPPGTGKSSLVQVLAGHFSRDVAMIPLGCAEMDDDSLRDLLVDAPRNAFLVIEDIDALFGHRDQTNDRNRLSFSGLLNAIDGVGAQQGRPLFMTTNHAEKLDPALVRPGRIDVRLTLGPASKVQAQRLHRLFFPDRPEFEAELFARLYAEGPQKTTAQIQAELLVHRHAPEKLLQQESTLYLVMNVRHS